MLWGLCFLVVLTSSGAASAASERDNLRASGDGRPSWDDERAQALVGKYVLVGRTYEGPDGSVLRREQLHGRIGFAHPTRGFCVSLEGLKMGMIYWLPPDLRPFTAASPGEYRLRSTGEVVVSPDLMANWIVTEHVGANPKDELRKIESARCPSRPH